MWEYFHFFIITSILVRACMCFSYLYPSPFLFLLYDGTSIYEAVREKMDARSLLGNSVLA